MASFLQVENISKSYGDKVLFRNISFNINEGDKIALIAPNGTGKSSLLKILAGLDSSDRGGEMKFMKDIKVAFLDQNIDFNPTNTLFDEVYLRLGQTYEVIASKKYISPDDRILIIDDFLANGSALKALISIAESAGATVVGAGIVIEKAFQPGGDEIRAMGYRIESLARVSFMGDDGTIEFC
jgi:ATPase subunit of ABC transporter with duplicated ATPase domains